MSDNQIACFECDRSGIKPGCPYCRIIELEADVKHWKNTAEQWQASSDELHDSNMKHGVWRREAEASIKELKAEQEVNDAAGAKDIKEIDRLTAEREKLLKRLKGVCNSCPHRDTSHDDDPDTATDAEQELDRLRIQVTELLESIGEDEEEIDRLRDERDKAMLDIGFFSKQVDAACESRDAALRECGGLQEKVRALLDGIGRLDKTPPTVEHYQHAITVSRRTYVDLLALAERLKQ